MTLRPQPTKTDVTNSPHKNNARFGFIYSHDSGQTGPSPLRSVAAQGDERLAAPSSTVLPTIKVTCRYRRKRPILATIKCEMRGPSPLRSEAAQGGEGLAAPTFNLTTAFPTNATHKTKGTKSTHRHGAPSNFSAGVDKAGGGSARVTV